MLRACAAGLSLGLPLAVSPVLASPQLPPIRSTTGNTVPACVTPVRLMRFVRSRNVAIPRSLQNIARTYEIVGGAYGVRWDMAFFQMLVETNDLTFRTSTGRPLYIRPEHYNFGGLTATSQEAAGEQFSSATLGVQAHIEHTLVYAGRRIAAPVAERTRKLIEWRVLDDWQREFDRPITFSDMALRWNPFRRAYADEILAHADAYYARYCPDVTNFNFQGSLSAGTERSTLAATRISSAWVSGPAAPSARLQPQEPARITPPKPRLAAEPSAADAVRPPTPARKPATAPPQIASLANVAPPPSRATSQPPASQPRQARRPASPEVKPSTRAKTKPAAKRVAEPKPPTADDRVRNLVGGRLVHLTADFGAVIPVLFDNNGTMRGQAGNLAFFLGASEDAGRWWVQKGMLCKKWETWFKGNEVCLKLQQRGKTVHWRSRDGRSGTAKIIR